MALKGFGTFRILVGIQGLVHIFQAWLPSGAGEASDSLVEWLHKAARSWCTERRAKDVNNFASPNDNRRRNMEQQIRIH